MIVAKDAAQGATTITWDAGAGVKNLGATLWQQIDGGKEKLVAAKAKGSKSILIGAGETRVFKLHNFIKSKVLASVTVTASRQGAAPDENAPNAGGAPANAADDAPTVSVTTVSFAGNWVQGLKIDDQPGTLTYKFEQIGNKVTGYAFRDNDEKLKIRFEGVVSGNKLSFRVSPAFTESNSGEFVMAQDGKSFTGNIGKTPVTAISPAWFAGLWRAKLGEGALELIFQQSGNQVTGQVKVNSADVGVIWESILVGNTLGFNIVRVVILPDGRTLPNEYVGRGELVLGADGKSFTGHVLGTATSGGTLIAR
ncbi:MAG TPA: hypothetical protein VFZ40_16770 [Pyrinomonadaceae bacterium]